MGNIQKIINNKNKESIKETGFPEWIDPMLAKLTDERFSDKSWIYERKLDGERCIAYKRKNDVKLYSRNKKIINNHYPEIENALKEINKSFIVDGEIVTFEGNLTSFLKLQKRINVKSADKARETGIEVYYYIFDILYLDSYLLEELPLRERKNILKKSIAFKDPIRYLLHRNEKGVEYYEEACKKGWEGLIAKDASAKYFHSRSSKWLKFKCKNRQEFIICGYTAPHGSRKGFGAIITGYYKNDQLWNAGKVGTGFDDETLEFLKEKMDKYKISDSPFSQSDEKTDHEITWLDPELVCEVEFTEWTEDDKLRHPAYKGLREDKKAVDVIKEG